MAEKILRGSKSQALHNIRHFFIFFWNTTGRARVVGDAEFIPMNIGTKHQQRQKIGLIGRKFLE